MSATWVRAQAFGQPLRWMEMSASKSRSRSSRRATSSSPRRLVSTMASLQNSMPVQAIVPRRHADGRASRPIPRSAVTSSSVRSGATSSTSSFWYGVSRTRPLPCASTTSASCASWVPETRPTTGAAPT